MKILYSGKKSVEEELKIMIRKYPEDHGLNAALSFLLQFPEFAKDPEIYSWVIKVAETGFCSGYRVLAARILHSLDDPKGLMHLVYAVLAEHPVQKQSQRHFNVKKYSIAFLLRAGPENITDECLDLIIKDMLDPLGNLQMDVLASLPGERIVPRMLPLLDSQERTAMQAAYVLALKGRDEGRPILKKLIESSRFVELAIIALSHIPDSWLLDTLHS